MNLLIKLVIFLGLIGAAGLSFAVEDEDTDCDTMSSISLSMYFHHVDNEDSKYMYDSSERISTQGDTLVYKFTTKSVEDNYKSLQTWVGIGKKEYDENNKYKICTITERHLLVK